MHTRLLSLGLGLFAVVALTALPSAAFARGRSISFSELVSRAADGGFPNGASRNPAISSDKRVSRFIAFESDASDLVKGDSNGLTDVFAVERNTHVSDFSAKNGSPWAPGKTKLVSRGRRGKPADGRSYLPALDGDSDHNASCLAFISQASNLVKGDTNGVADAFVRYLHNGKTRRVSVSSSGKQANGPTTGIAIDGSCTRVAFASDATNLGTAVKASSHSVRGAANGDSQIYVRYLRGEDRGATILASASGSGRPGNGDSSQPAFARKGNALAFTSLASNLAGRDSNGTEDVFLRNLHRFKANRAQPQFKLATKLLSATSSGRSGNGPSSHPSVDSKARFIAFQSDASNLTGSGHRQIIRVDRQDHERRVVSTNRDGSIGNGDSGDPVVSAIGYFVFFDSDATNFRPPGHARDQNGNPDVFKWYQLTGNTALESRDFHNVFIHQSSQNPAVGLHGNYVPYESVDPTVDGDVRSSVSTAEVPPLIKAGLEPPPPFPPDVDPGLYQIYLRYVGPCARTETLPDGTRRCFLR